jgi:hypothetical protein
VMKPTLDAGQPESVGDGRSDQDVSALTRSPNSSI